MDLFTPRFWRLFKYAFHSSIAFASIIWLFALAIGIIGWSFGMLFGWVFVTLLRWEGLNLFENWLGDRYQALPNGVIWFWLFGAIDAGVFVAVYLMADLLLPPLKPDSLLALEPTTLILAISVGLAVIPVLIGIPWSALLWLGFRPPRTTPPIESDLCDE